MNIKILLSILLITSSLTYDRNKAVNYALKYAKGANHDCKQKRESCSPYPYYGKDYCSYKKESFGDCANFVSQCLIAGGLNFKGTSCNVRSCGVITGANSLGKCLRNHFKWKRECGKDLPPPAYIQKGDVIIYHQDSCESDITHAMIITVGGKNAMVTGHSPHVRNIKYANNKKKHYYEWIHFEG